jgi:DNA gyrase/topoisomerase IV subunit A
LSKSFAENLTVIDENGKLREYDDPRDLIKDFCDFRLSVLSKRIEARLNSAEELARWLKVKMEFIQAVLDDKITFKNQKKAAVSKQILATTSATADDVDRLLRINIMSLTDELVKQLAKEIKEAEKDYKFWSKETPKNQFISDIAELRN